jgi:hypothetical protein
MAWTYDNQDWARLVNGQIQLKNADGSWSNAGTPEHAESMSYVQKAADSAEVDKLIAYARAGGSLNAEQSAFLANPLLGMDSYGQGSRWGAINLFDNQFSPQQSGALQQFGVNANLSPADIAAGQQFNQEQSPAAQSARSDSGGFGLMQLAMLAAAVYSGGAALGAWGAGAGAAAGATTASGMLAAESAALLAEGFTAAEVAGSLAGLGNAAQIGSVLTAAGVSSATAATLAGDVASGMLTGANAGSGAMDWTDVLGEWPSYGDASSGGNMFDPSSLFPDFTNYSGQMSSIPGLEQSLTQVPLNLSAGAGLASTPWYQQLLQQAADNPLGTANQTLKALNSSGLLSGGLSAVGGYLSGNAAQDAASKAAAAQIEAAKIAADAAKFKPIGVTTRFGQSDFTKDANGNVIGAGYNLTPDVKAQQDALMAQSGQMLSQYQNAPAAFAPMGDAGQRAMSLGNQYLATDPAAQAQKYMQEQQALLATGRDRDMSQMLSGEYNRGTYGLATGATGMMGAANPRLEALMNAQRQQDLGLAAQATQGGMDYAKFGAGMVGTGGDLTKGMYAGQTAAYDPYKTALGGAQTLEGLGQQALTMGMDLGRQTSNAAAGGLLAQGMNSAAQTMQPANAYSPWGAMLSGAGNAVANYTNPAVNQQYKFDPFTGRPL